MLDRKERSLFACSWEIQAMKMWSGEDYADNQMKAVTSGVLSAAAMGKNCLHDIVPAWPMQDTNVALASGSVSSNLSFRAGKTERGEENSRSNLNATRPHSYTSGVCRGLPLCVCCTTIGIEVVPRVVRVERGNDVVESFITSPWPSAIFRIVFPSPDQTACTGVERWYSSCAAAKGMANRHETPIQAPIVFVERESRSRPVSGRVYKLSALSARPTLCDAVRWSQFRRGTAISMRSAINWIASF
jgi:hypothetical protein